MPRLFISLLLWCSTLPAWASPLALPVFHGAIMPAEHHRLPIEFTPGDFIQGRFRGKGVRLDLVDAQGSVVRTLATGLSEEDEFRFVVGDAGPYRFDLSATLPRDFHVEIVRRIARAEQTPVIELPESPVLRQWLKTGASSEEFWRDIEASGAPLIEMDGVEPPLAPHERLVTFLWRGAKRSVRLFGGPSADHDELTRLADTDIWYRSYRLPDSTFIAYRFAPDVPELDLPQDERRRAILATAQRDPFNPQRLERSPHCFDDESLLQLPAAPANDWRVKRSDIPAGSMETHRLTSQVLKNTRDIHLYRPAHWRPGAPGNALLVVFDGDAYTCAVPTPTILDNLISAGRLPPTAAVFITHPSNALRSAELPPNVEFARFLAEELMPWAARQGLYAVAERTVIAGASYGGLAAAWAAFVHPEIFGKVYSQSGSFWWAPEWEKTGLFTVENEWLTRRFAVNERLPIEFRLEAGLFEMGMEGLVGIRDATRHLRDILQVKGYRVSHREYASGHGFEHWRVSFADGLISLIGTKSGTYRSAQ